ncbi:hypothetical protein ACOM2C_14630 [Pseudarthrobacter sp. So.54]
MKNVLARTAAVVLTAVLTSAALPATAATTLPPNASPIVLNPAVTPAAGKSGAVSTDGIRDEFARLRCLFFRC